MTAPPNRIWEHSFFFTPQERDRVAKAKPSFHNSITTRVLHPVWCLVSKLIPDSVAPNAISLLGVVFALQAYQVVQRSYAIVPEATTNIAVALLLLSIVCSSVDGVHAVRCRSATPLGVIFSKVTSAARHVFLGLTLCTVLGIQSPMVQWYLIMTIQLVQLSNLFYVIDEVEERSQSVRPNLAALRFFRWAKSTAFLFNTTEASMVEVLILLGRQHFVSAIPSSALDTAAAVVPRAASLVYWSALCATLLTLAIMRTPNGLYKWTVLLCILVRAVPLDVLPLWDSSEIGVVADAAMLGLLSIEVRLSAIARRPLHAGVVTIIVCSLGSAVFGLVAAVLYVVGMLTDLSYSTGTPLFVPVRNVYIDGVFDLCHIGHKRLMEYALSHGNRLIVGVLSDEECIKYKRKPIMTLDERCREVASCKWVSEVVPDAPNGVTEEFIQKHNIHICVYGEEYEKPDDLYYAVPRRLGIGRLAPRTQGMSTSELIRRIVATSAEELAAKDKLSGKSTVKE